jgi:uroporphyrinogen decarboxylase
MYEWLKLSSGGDVRKAMPIMTYPGLGLTGKNVMDVISDGESQFKCIEALSKRYPSIATLTIMDLSVEAEAFGAKIRFSEQEVPTVIGNIINDLKDAQNLKIPAVGEGRTREYLKTAKLASENIKDRPVFAGEIGPLSLAGRLIGISECMVIMLDEPEIAHTVLEKCTQFLIEYSKAFKKAGANGLIIAEPVAGLLSPNLCGEFSSQYVRKIVEAVQDENFIVILHNCGNTVKLVDSMVSTGAAGFHFGNAVKMKDIMPQIPPDRIGFGNIEPSGVFRSGSRAEMKQKVTDLLNDMKPYPNYILSSGCDVPPGTPLENVDAFFEALAEFNVENR